MAETQTPIEALKRAQIYNCHSADPEHCKLPICTDARAALEDVEAVVKALRVAQELAERPDKVGFHEEADFIVWQREANLSDRNTHKALAKFPEES